MLRLRFDPMGYKPPKITTQVSLRVSVAFKKKADGIRRCWEEIARVKGDLDTGDDKEPEGEVELTHVMRELLELKIDEEISELTGGRGFPKSDDESAWRELLKSVPVSYAKSKQSR